MSRRNAPPFEDRPISGHEPTAQTLYSLPIPHNDTPEALGSDIKSLRANLDELAAKLSKALEH